MRIAYLTELPSGSPLTGGMLRQAGLLHGLTSHGVDVEVVRLTGPRGRRLATRWRHLTRASELLPFLPEADALHVEWLAPAWAAVAARQLGTPAVVDLCDSWARVRMTAVPASPRARLHRRAALMSVDHVMRRALPSATAVTYVAAEDEEWDTRRYGPFAQSMVVGNGVTDSLLAVDPSPVPTEGYVAFPADFSYGPNMEALAWLAAEVWPRCAGLLKTPIHLFGPHEPTDLPLPPEIRYAGFAPDLRELYDRASLVIAPMRSGGGLKNKIIEPMARGRPVLTTPEGIAGLPPSLRDFPVVAADASSFAEALVRLAHVRERQDARLLQARAAVSALTWSAVTEPLVGLYERILSTVDGR